MNTPQFSGGYTIVETMIFLAVSTLMFASVVGVMGTRNRRTEFTQSVNNLNQQLLDVINDVDTGYYPASGNFRCSVGISGAPEITSTATERGKNQDCIYAGRAIQFAPSVGGQAKNSKLNIYTIVASRYKNVTDKKEASNIDETKAIALPTNYSLDTIDISAQTEIKKIIYQPGTGSGTTGGGFAIINGFGVPASGDSVGMKSGNISSSLSAVAGSALGQDQSLFMSKIPNLRVSSQDDVSGGILLCLGEPGANGRWASILLGGEAGYNQTIVTIDDVVGECKT